MNSNISKHLLVFITSISTMVGSNARGEEPAQANPIKKDSQCVVITYSKPIEGYEVMIFWRPQELLAGHLIGPAILEFTHKEAEKSFSLTNDHFGLPDTNGWMTTAVIHEGYYVKSSQPHLTLNYMAPELIGQLPSTSFFFVDLDFDGKKELVLTEIANGPRWRNTYRVCSPDRMGNPDGQPLTNQEPYASLDSESVINLRNRTIHLFHSGGANINEELIYKFDEEQGQYRLAK